MCRGGCGRGLGNGYSWAGLCQLDEFSYTNVQNVLRSRREAELPERAFPSWSLGTRIILEPEPELEKQKTIRYKFRDCAVFPGSSSVLLRVDEEKSSFVFSASSGFEGPSRPRS